MFKREQYQLRKNNKEKTKNKKETDNNKGLFFYYFLHFCRLSEREVCGRFVLSRYENLQMVFCPSGLFKKATKTKTKTF